MPTKYAKPTYWVYGLNCYLIVTNQSPRRGDLPKEKCLLKVIAFLRGVFDWLGSGWVATGRAPGPGQRLVVGTDDSDQ
jgi:hypothetical protein